MDSQKIQLYMNFAVMCCTCAGFVYGVIKFFKRGKALYLQMIVCALGCMMLGRLFQGVMLLTAGHIPTGFHVGRLGVVGGFLFFFSANYGQMDSLVDDGTKQFVKYRLLALIAPILILACYIPVWMHTDRLQIRIVCGVLTFVIMLAAYFNLKHLIMPDVELGIIACIRGYNLNALIFAVLCMAEMAISLTRAQIPMIIVNVLTCVVSLAIIPVLERGVKKWTI